MTSTIFALVALAVFGLGYWLSSKRNRRQLKCWIGIHAPDRIVEEGSLLTQRCFYCDRVVHQFEKDRQGRIRRTV